MAEDVNARPWYLSGSLSGWQAADGGDAVRGSGSLSLERRFDETWVGASIGASRGEAAPPPLLTTTVVDQSSLQIAVWVGKALGAYNLTLSLGHGRQSMDGEAVIASETAPAALSDRSFGFDGEITARSIGVFASRPFGETWTFTPTLGVSYDRSESEQTGSLRSGVAPLRVGSTAEGVTGSLGSTISGPINDLLTLSFGVVGFATDNGAAQTLQFGRQGSERPFAPQAEGSAQWGEVSGGLTWSFNDRVSVSGTAGGALGRQSDTAFASASIGVWF